MTRERALALVSEERDRQDRKWHKGAWAPEDSPELKVTVLTEEVGEVARAVLHNDATNLQTELVQVAAVAVSILETLEG